MRLTYECRLAPHAPHNSRANFVTYRLTHVWIQERRTDGGPSQARENRFLALSLSGDKRSGVAAYERVRSIGGEGGIRTPDTLASMPHFECGAFNHSATSPKPPDVALCPWKRKSFLPILLT